MEAVRRFWARSVWNKASLLLCFSLVFCCCGTFRISGAPPAEARHAAPYAAAGGR